MEKVAILHKALKSEEENEWNAEQFRDNVEDFMQHLRSNLGTKITYFNKLHVLEAHLPELVDAYGVLGSYSEQSSEALHYLLEKRMENFKRKAGSSNDEFELNKLEYSLRVQIELVYLSDGGYLY